MDNAVIVRWVSTLLKINDKCYISWFSSISQRILILFVLSDRAGWGLQNFYNELWHSLIMQIYANLVKKINEKCYISPISQRIWFCLFYLIGLGGGFKTSTLNCEIHYLCKFMQIYSKSIKNATSPLFRSGFWFCLFYLIGMGGGFKTFTLNCEIH